MRTCLSGSPLLALVAAVGLAATLLVAPPATSGAYAATDYPGTERIAGGDAVSVAVNLSRRLFDDGEADAVVLARKDKHPDSLAATGFARSVGAPILFTATHRLEPATRDELQRVLDEGKKVYLLGGREAIESDVEQAIDDLGYRTPRFPGVDRIDTAALIAEEMGRPGTEGRAMLVRSRDDPAASPGTQAWLDAVSCGGFAAFANTPLPVVLTDSNADEVAQRTISALDRIGASEVVICGGTAAVPQSHADQLQNAGFSTSRFAGLTRISTATDVARRLWGYGNASGRTFVLTNGFGRNFAFGIAASQLSGREAAPLLLVDVDEPESCDTDDQWTWTLCYLDGSVTGGRPNPIAGLIAVGSTDLISDAMFRRAAEAGGLERDTNPPPVPDGVGAEDTPDVGRSVTVSWNAVADPEGGTVRYDVFFREHEDGVAVTRANSTKAGGSGTTDTGLEVTGLQNDTRYDFKVAAVDRFGNASDLSRQASATPTDEVPSTPETAPSLEAVPDGVRVSFPPPAERDAAAVVISRAEAALDDCTPENPLVSYDDEYAVVDDLSRTAFTDTEVDEGTTYCYRYAVRDLAGQQGGFSPVDSIEA